MKLTIRPLTPELWPALEDLFGKRGAANGCWCMYGRIGSALAARPGSGPGVREPRGSQNTGSSARRNGLPVAACNRLAAAYHELRCLPCRSAPMELTVVPIVKPEAANFILGQSHFIKTVEDLHEALVGAVPGIRFGLAFCEASGKRLVRWSGNDEAALALA